MRDAEEADREAVESKVEAVAFGFLVPVFFIYTGVTFDLAALLADPILFADRCPLVLVVLFVVRGLPSTLAAPTGSSRRTASRSRSSGRPALPIIVAVTAIGVDEGVLHDRRCRAARRRGHAVGAAVPAHRDDPARRADDCA